MPFYDYECTACSLEFSAFQRLSDVPYLTCHDCGGVLKTLFSVRKKEEEKMVVREPDWKPDMTDVHKGWSKRREWKHGSVESMETGKKKINTVNSKKKLQ